MVSEATGAFLTHANYLRAFDTTISCTYGDRPWLLANDLDVLTGLAKRNRDSGYLTRFHVGVDVDKAVLRRAVRNAWGSELLLASASAHDQDLLSVANNWNVVQAYYACYQAVQALAAARGLARVTTHQKLQNQFTSTWVVPSVVLPPWSFGWQSDGPKNLPPDLQIRKVTSAWETCDQDSCWSLALMALKSTREDVLKPFIKNKRKEKLTERRKIWDAEQDARKRDGKRTRKPSTRPTARPRLTSSERTSIDANLRATTIIDYLYRLRIRSNYQDPTMFTDGPESPMDSVSVHRSLTSITAATLLLYELHIGSLIGKDALCALLDEWLEDCGNAARGVGARKGILVAFC